MKSLGKYTLLFLIPVSALLSQGYVAAIGGGTVPDNVYQWIVEKSGKGKIIVLGYTDASDHLPNLFKSFGSSQSYNLTIDSRAKADQQGIYDEISSADGVYLRGGNQWIYVRDWKGTKTDDAIREVFDRGGVVAGTSAGAAVLGELVFTAQYGTVYPNDALHNPFSGDLALEDGFINVVPRTLFDTHFIERGRFGRLIPFLFKIYIQRGQNILGIGLDDQTALCINPQGIGKVMGTGAVAFYNFTNETNIVSTPFGYTIENIIVNQLVEGWEYDINERKVSSIPSSAHAIDADRKLGLPKTPIWLSAQDDVQFNVSKLIPLFITEHEPSSISIIICSSEYLPTIDPLRSFLEDNGFEYFVFVAESSFEDNDISLIESSSAIVFAGNRLISFEPLTDLQSSFRQVLHSRIVNDNIPIAFFGNTGKLASSLYVDNVDEEEWAAYLGKMTVHTGLDIFNDMIFQPLLYDDPDYYENRTASVLWGLMKNHSRFGLYLNSDEVVAIDHSNGFITRYGEFPFIIVNAQHTEWVDSSQYRVQGSGSTRQVVAMTDLRYNVSTLATYYVIEAGEFGTVSSVTDDIPQLPFQPTLHQNYPNPFNNRTIIRFSIPTESQISLTVYDILGNIVRTLVNEKKAGGHYEVAFDIGHFQHEISSGVYFYKLTTEFGSQVGKMIYLR